MIRYQMIRFKGAYLELFGARLLPLPGLAIRTDGQAVSGVMVAEPADFAKQRGGSQRQLLLAAWRTIAT